MNSRRILPRIPALLFGLSLAVTTHAATWTAGNGDYSQPTNWDTLAVPCFEIVPVANDAIIDIAGVTVSQDMPVCSVESLTLGVGVTLSLEPATDYNANSTDIAGFISGIGGDLTATGAIFSGSAARLFASLGSVIDIDATALDATATPAGSVPLLSASGTDSRLTLATLAGIDSSFDSNSASVQAHTVSASDGATIDLSGLTTVTVPFDVEDRLSFEVSNTGAMNLDSLSTASGTGQIRFVVDDNGSLSLPGVTDLAGGHFVATTGGQLFAGSSAWTMDSINRFNNNYVLVSATNSGSLLDLSGMTALDANFDTLSSTVQAHTVSASDGGSVDLSGLTTVTVPFDVEDRLSFEVSNTGAMNLDSLSTASGRGQARFFVSDGGSLSLPGLTNLEGGHFVATTGGQLFAGSSAWTMDSINRFNNNYVLVSATNPGSLLDLSGMTALDANFDTLSSTVQAHTVSASDGGSVDLSGLTTVTVPFDVEDRLSFEVSNTGAMNLDSLSTASGRGQARFFVSDGGSLSLPGLTNLEGGHFVATTGGQLFAATSTWTMDSINRFNNNYVLVSATNPGSLLDLSGMTALDASFNTNTGSVQTHTVSASDGGSVDLSGLTTVTVPFDVEDRLSFDVSGTATLNLDSLSTASGRGQVRFSVSDGGSLGLPGLANVEGGHFVATTGGQLFAASSAWTMDSIFRFNNNYVLASATNPGSLLDLSGMTALDASFNSLSATVQTHTVTVDDNATLDMSGLNNITAPVDVEDLLALLVGDGGTLALGPLANVTGVGRVRLTINPADASVEFPRSLDAAAKVEVLAVADSRVEVIGHVRFRHTDESDFNLETARVSVEDASPLTVEVGGNDEGTNPSTTPNFGFAQLIVGSATQTTTAVLVDQVDNGNGFAVCAADGEALYLHGFDVGPDADGLRLLNGSTLDLGGGINLYAAVGNVLMHINPMLTPGVPFPYDEGFIELGNPPDTDGDGIVDSADNCVLNANADQRDSNGDGFGNICDADLNNDQIVNVIDLGILRTVFFTNDADADFNGDGVVNAIDLGIMKLLFFAPPGPSCVMPT